MSHRILITGASGYLGGTLFARWAAADLPAYAQLYALVRTADQAQAVKKYGAEPLFFDIRDVVVTRQAIIKHSITIVFFLVDAGKAESQVPIIQALAEVKKETGRDVHFLHTSGAKIFSSHAGAPTNRPLLDSEPDLYDIQKSQKSLVPPLQSAIDANNMVIELAESLGVHSYIFVPCIVYGKGEGFGNKISIQTVAIIRAALALRRVYSVDSGRPTWPVCHVIDNTNLYLQLLRQILAGQQPQSGKQGYYLAASGSVAWTDLYAAIAAALARRGVVDDARVDEATDDVLTEMGAALGCPKQIVRLQLGGSCTFTARHGESIGWRAIHAAGHILEVADEEVELVLAHLDN